MHAVTRAIAWVILFQLGAAAEASDFHATLACQTCHARGGHLSSTDEVKICLSCHGNPNNSAPFVLYQTVSGAVPRSAGSLAVTSDIAPYPGPGPGYGHVIGSSQPPPGFQGTWPAGMRLTCISCHAVHSNRNYRSLGRDPVVGDPAYLELAAIYNAGNVPSATLVPDASALKGAVGADVFISSTNGADSYDASRIFFSTNGGRNAMNAFCAACHAQFHGDANTVSGGRYVRHPTSGVPLSDPTQSAFDSVAQPLRATWSDPKTAQASCLTCHRAHGTTNSFGLVFWDRYSATNGENGAAAQVEGLCYSCHQLD